MSCPHVPPRSVIRLGSGLSSNLIQIRLRFLRGPASSRAKLPGVLSVNVGFSPPVDLRVWSLDYDGHGVAVRYVEVRVVFQNTRERARLGFLKRSGHNGAVLRGPVKGST